MNLLLVVFHRFISQNFRFSTILLLLFLYSFIVLEHVCSKDCSIIVFAISSLRVILLSYLTLMRLPEANNKSRIPKNKYIPTSVLSSISIVSLIPESYFFALFCFFYKLDTNLRFPNHLNKPNDFIIIFEFLRSFKSNQRREIYYRSLPLSLLVEENFHA